MKITLTGKEGELVMYDSAKNDGAIEMMLDGKIVRLSVDSTKFTITAKTAKIASGVFDSIAGVRDTAEEIAIDAGLLEGVTEELVG